MWASKDNGKKINWKDAKQYCKNYRGGSYTDWRLPTQDELVGLYDRRSQVLELSVLLLQHPCFAGA